MITVELKNARFFGYHGLYPEEKKTGNEFEVNLQVYYDPAHVQEITIDTTVNYVRLFELVKAMMYKPAELLETLAAEIAEKVKNEFPFINGIRISISKLHPPVPQFTGNVVVHYHHEY